MMVNKDHIAMNEATGSTHLHTSYTTQELSMDKSYKTVC